MAQGNIACPISEYTVIDASGEDETAETIAERINELAAKGWTISTVIPPASVGAEGVTATLVIMARQTGLCVLVVEVGIVAASGSFLAP